MNRKILFCALPVASTLAMLAPAAASAHQLPSPMTASQRVPAPGSMRQVGKVTAITTRTVTLTFPHPGKSQTLDLSQLSLRAAFYPTTSAILRPGQRIALWPGKPGTWRAVVLPAACGTLSHSQTAGAWTVTSHQGATWPLAIPAHLPMAGMHAMQNQQRVMVFGAKTSHSGIQVSMIAAMPEHLRGTVQSNQAGRITLTTGQGTFTYMIPASLPSASPWRQSLASLKPGQVIQVFLNPENRQVLALIPHPSHHGRQMVRNNVTGLLLSHSSQEIQLTTAWGHATILTHGRPVSVIWPGHASASLSQIPAGQRVWIHLSKNSEAIEVRVLGNEQSAMPGQRSAQAARPEVPMGAAGQFRLKTLRRM